MLNSTPLIPQLTSTYPVTMFLVCMQYDQRQLYMGTKDMVFTVMGMINKKIVQVTMLNLMQMTRQDRKQITEQSFIILVYPRKLLSFVANTINMHMGTTVASKIHELLSLSTFSPLFLKYDRKQRLALPQTGINPAENWISKLPTIVRSLFLQQFWDFIYGQGESIIEKEQRDFLSRCKEEWFRKVYNCFCSGLQFGIVLVFQTFEIYIVSQSQKFLISQFQPLNKNKMPNLIQNKRILDLSRIIVGPYASSVLSGFGCQIIKIQSPEGDPTRLWGPPWNNNTSTYFESVNCNKKSVALNFKQPACRQVLYRLVEKADIVLENFVPGVTQKLKIDYETLTRYNPKLVYCSVSGYGDFGSKADFPAFDNIIQAETGFMHLTGNKTQPFKMGFAITDVLTALYASNAILAGIIYTQQTGKGIHLKTSLYECAISSLINQASNYLNGGVNPQRLGNHHPNIVPYGLYTANDGEVVICVGTVKQYEGLLKSLGVNSKDQKLQEFATNESRVKNRLKFDEFLNEELKRFTSDEIIKRLDENKVPCGRVNDLQKVFSSDLAKELKMVENIGNTKMIRNPIRTHLQPPNSQSFSSDINLHPPPNVGQHTNEILKSILGMTESEIKLIEKLNIVK